MKLSDDGVPMKFTDAQKTACEGHISLAECTEALKSLKKYKAPGCDCIPAEFYVYFWPETGPKLVEIIVVKMDCYHYLNAELP